MLLQVKLSRRLLFCVIGAAVCTSGIGASSHDLEDEPPRVHPLFQLPIGPRSPFPSDTSRSSTPLRPPAGASTSPLPTAPRVHRTVTTSRPQHARRVRSDHSDTRSRSTERSIRPACRITTYSSSAGRARCPVARPAAR